MKNDTERNVSTSQISIEDARAEAISELSTELSYPEFLEYVRCVKLFLRSLRVKPSTLRADSLLAKC